VGDRTQGKSRFVGWNEDRRVKGGIVQTKICRRHGAPWPVVGDGGLELGWTIMRRCTRTGCSSQRSVEVAVSVLSQTAPYKRRQTAIVFSLGCQLAWRIFLLKSRGSSCIASFNPGFTPFLAASGLLPGKGPPIFFALNADLSACNTMSFSVSTSKMRR